MSDERKYPRRFVSACGTWLAEMTHATVSGKGGAIVFHYRDGTIQRTCFDEILADDCVSRGSWREVFDQSEPPEEKIINPNCADITQLRTQLADARRVISELEAAQGIAVHELGRQRELAAARLRTIHGLNLQLKKQKQPTE